MNGQKVKHIFELASKICAVMTIAAVALSTTPAVILFNLTLLFSIISGNLREKFRLIFHNPISWVFILFFCLVLVGVAYTSGPMSEILIDLRKHSKYIFILMFLPIFTEEKWRESAILSYLAAVFVMLICSYLKPYGYFNWAKGGPIEVFKISMEFNLLMAFGTYLCLLQIFSHRSWYRVFWVVFCLLVLHTVLFRSVGRTGYFVVFGLWLLFFTQKFRWRGFVFSVITLTLLVGMAFKFSSTFQNRNLEASKEFIHHLVVIQNKELVGQVSPLEGPSVGMRMTFVENGFKIIKAHPLIGTGTGSYIKEYTSLKPIPPDIGFIKTNPHNEYLYIAVQYGILGLLVLILFFSVPLFYSKFLPEREKYIARGIIISIMIGSLANNWLLDMTPRYLYAYFVILAFAAFPLQRSLRFKL